VRISVIFRRFGVTIVVVQKQLLLAILSMCLYSRLSYPTRKAHAPYYTRIAVYGLSSPTIFFHNYLTNGTIFERKKKSN